MHLTNKKCNYFTISLFHLSILDSNYTYIDDFNIIYHNPYTNMVPISKNTSNLAHMLLIYKHLLNIIN